METDASLVEINPLILEGNGNIKALDAKFNFDSQRAVPPPRDRGLTATWTKKTRPKSKPASSIWPTSALDGNIGCLVNGAGLAMATMDTIKLFGGEPANFLDVGGGATPEKVTEAFKIMLKNKNVKGILVNIFGGIMKCDTIATGVIAACKAVNLSGAAGRAHEGHQRRTRRQEAAGRFRPAHHQRRHDGRSGPEGRRGRQSKE